MTFVITLLFLALLAAVGFATFCLKRAQAVSADNKELRAMLIEAERKDASQEPTVPRFPVDRFLLRIVHEMRTPLNAIEGTMGMLEDTNLDRQQDQLVRMIRLGGDNLKCLLDDIQRFSRIESGLEKSEVTEFSPVELVEVAVAGLRSALGQKPVEVYYDFGDSLPAQALGDADHISLVLNNLLNNAVKFTRRGSIRVSVSADLDGQDQRHLVMSVKDTGIGVSQEQLQNVFNPVFEDSADSDEIIVSGFGNYLSYQMCQMMDGSMWVESEEYVGSTFSFKVPISSVEADTQELPDLKGLMRVFVVSANDEYAHFLKSLTEGLLVKVTTYTSIQEALKEQPTIGDECAVLVDADLWDQRSADFSKDLEQMRSLSARLVIAAKSGSWKRFSKDEVLQRVPMLPKPVVGSALAARLAEARPPKQIEVDMSNRLSKGSDTRAPLATHSLRILIAEDNKVNQQVTQMLLGRLGYRGDIVEDGREVLERIQDERYDVILMDINMPNMNGIETAREVFDRIPDESERPAIIALTAAVTTATQTACREAGMSGFISKPLKLSVLQKALSSVIERVAG